MVYPYAHFDTNSPLPVNHDIHMLILTRTHHFLSIMISICNDSDTNDEDGDSHKDKKKDHKCHKKLMRVQNEGLQKRINAGKNRDSHKDKKKDHKCHKKLMRVQNEGLQKRINAGKNKESVEDGLSDEYHASVNAPMTKQRMRYKRNLICMVCEIDLVAHKKDTIGCHDDRSAYI
eukprot:1082964_1